MIYFMHVTRGDSSACISASVHNWEAAVLAIPLHPYAEQWALRSQSISVVLNRDLFLPAIEFLVVSSIYTTIIIWATYRFYHILISLR